MKEKRFTYPSQPLSQKKVAKFAEAIETENNESPNTYLQTISCGISHTDDKEISYQDLVLLLPD